MDKRKWLQVADLNKVVGQISSPKDGQALTKLVQKSGQVVPETISSCLWKCSKNVKMWPLGAWFSCEYSGVNSWA